jgi:hypothetical protein
MAAARRVSIGCSRDIRLGQLFEPAALGLEHFEVRQVYDAHTLAGVCWLHCSTVLEPSPASDPRWDCGCSGGGVFCRDVFEFDPLYVILWLTYPLSYEKVVT